MSYWSMKREIKEFLEEEPGNVSRSISDVLLCLGVLVVDLWEKEEEKKKEDKKE